MVGTRGLFSALQEHCCNRSVLVYWHTPHYLCLLKNSPLFSPGKSSRWEIMSSLLELSYFQPYQDSVGKLIWTSTNKTYKIDPLPTWLLKHCLPELLPLITSVVDTSLASSTVPKRFKTALGRPLLKKPSLDQHLSRTIAQCRTSLFYQKWLKKQCLSI